MKRRDRKLLRATVKALQDNAKTMRRLSKILKMYVEDAPDDDSDGDESSVDESLTPDHPGQGKPRRAGIIKHGDVLIAEKSEISMPDISYR